MLIAQMTDLHAVARGTLAFGRVDTNAALAAAVDHVNAIRPRVDLVVITGDVANDGRTAEYDAAAAALARLEAPVRVIPGNHDDRARLRAAFGAMMDHVPAPVSSESFLHYVDDRFPLRLIALDTVVPGQPGGALCADRLAWLAGRLAEAPGRPTVILMHHPPFQIGVGHMDGMACAGGEAAAEVVARFPAVERVLCGHVHRPVVRRWGGTIAFACPSPAHQVALDLTGAGPPAWTRDPPAVALHLWQPAPGADQPAAGTVVSHLSFIGPWAAERFGAPGVPVPRSA